ncbi:MAG: DUF4398 domain-containing protein [Bryobacterales bacterium]|nr:DUF4398 domain-containing protein [Bryobacterales bacterium]
MKRLSAFLPVASTLFLSLSPTFSQTPPQNRSPLYQVTVINRTTKAVNYGHRNGPTKIGFQGTVLSPEANGEATVDARRGAVEIGAKFAKLGSPQRFGPQYLTYVLWAITPQGRPMNLGEVVPNHADKAKLHVSTDLQSFALIVTAEPYYSVTQPGNVVVLENKILPETVGRIEEVDARYELLPRGHYTYEVGKESANANTPMVSMDQYEAILALYEAQNALQIAEAAGARQYANGALDKAAALYQQARALNQQKGRSKQVVTVARQAAQAAEDARLLTVKRQRPGNNEQTGSGGTP